MLKTLVLLVNGVIDTFQGSWPEVNLLVRSEKFNQYRGQLKTVKIFEIAMLGGKPKLTAPLVFKFRARARITKRCD